MNGTLRYHQLLLWAMQLGGLALRCLILFFSGSVTPFSTVVKASVL